MFFASLVFLSAFLIESIGSYISIVGLSALFSTNPVIIALALSLDIAKVVTVSFLYKQWENISRSMKYYMTAAAVILMVITSSGAAGYLSAEFQKAIIPTKGSEIQVRAMTDEKDRLSARKVEIDKQVSQLPPENVRGRQRLQKQFAPELEHINSRIIEIDKELPKLQMQQVDVNAHAGPILYIAQAFDTTVESAVKYVILLIIFVFDPLAVALIIAGNFLVDQRRKELKEEAIQAAQINEKLSDIKHDVEHIEEIVEHQQPVETPIDDLGSQFIPHDDEPQIPFECIQPVVDAEQKATEIEVLPTLDEMPAEELEILEDIKDKLVNEEFPPLPEDKLKQLAALNQQLNQLLAEDGPKKRRGRPKKDEAEPKPSIQTEEQLEAILQEPLDLPTDEEVAQLIPEELKADSGIDAVEEINTILQLPIEESDEAVSEGLANVNHHSADVIFHSEVEQISDNWKATKKVLNHYAS